MGSDEQNRPAPPRDRDARHHWEVPEPPPPDGIRGWFHPQPPRRSRVDAFVGAAIGFGLSGVILAALSLVGVPLDEMPEAAWFVVLIPVLAIMLLAMLGRWRPVAAVIGRRLGRMGQGWRASKAVLAVGTVVAVLALASAIYVVLIPDS